MKRVALSLVVAALGLAGMKMLHAGDVPKVPEKVRELLQDRKYDEVADAIDKLLSDPDSKPEHPDYLLYLKGRALDLSGKHREALAVFARFEAEQANSPWARRARFGQAAALLKSGDFEAA